MIDCWTWAVEKTELLKGSVLKAEKILAVTICDDCGKTYSTVEHGRICPFCFSENTQLVCESEILIKEIDASSARMAVVIHESSSVRLQSSQMP